MSSAPKDTATAAIELRSVTKTYSGGTKALAGIDLVIEAGEFVALTGPSGCGKSTLLNLIAALDTPTTGTVAVGGIDLATIHDLARFRREKVGLVFQLHNLIPQISVLANIEVVMFSTGRSSSQRRARAMELVDTMRLGGRQDRLPTQLSGGERQRVAIARALANEPQLILADEPTGSLDTASSAMVLDTFAELNTNGVTVLLVTHDQGVADKAHRRVSMRDGLVVDDTRRA
jgi:putative ABC transport system ATP-binding protein